METIITLTYLQEENSKMEIMQPTGQLVMIKNMMNMLSRSNLQMANLQQRGTTFGKSNQFSYFPLTYIDKLAVQQSLTRKHTK